MDRDPPGETDAWRRRVAAALSDQRGGSFVQALILLVFLALAGIGAFKALSGRVADASDCAGQAIVTLGSASGPCAEGGGFGPGGGSGPVASAPTPNGGTGGDPSGAAGPGDSQPGDGQAGDGQAGDGQAGDGQAGDGQAGDGQAGDGQAGGEGEKDDPGFKVGSNGSVKSKNNGKQTSGEKTFGGAPPKSAEDQQNDAKKKSTTGDVEIGGEKTLFSEEGALGEKKFFGDSEKLRGGFGKADGTAFAKASIKDGAAVGAKVEGKVSAVNLKGEHELPGGIEESHEVDVLSVKGSLEGKAGISKDVIGATVSGEAGANLAEAQIEGKKVFKLPFTDVGLEIGGSGSASAGANIGGEATAGSFKGKDGKRRVGLKGGFKAALGLGLGGKLSLNLVFGD